MHANDQALRRNLSRMLNEYAADQAAIQRGASRRKSFRYTPTPFHNMAVEVLGRGDSEAVASVIHMDELSDYLGTVKE
jgi:hypothetical protein